MTAERDLDVVVYGATGFVGKLTAEYLARAAPEGTNIALGGRSQTRLEQVRARTRALLHTLGDTPPDGPPG